MLKRNLHEYTTPAKTLPDEPAVSLSFPPGITQPYSVGGNSELFHHDLEYVRVG